MAPGPLELDIVTLHSDAPGRGLLSGVCHVCHPPPVNMDGNHASAIRNSDVGFMNAVMTMGVIGSGSRRRDYLAFESHRWLTFALHRDQL